MKYVLNYVRSIWQGLGMMVLAFIFGQTYHDLSLGVWMYVLMAVWAVSMVLDFYLTSREPSEAYKQYLKNKQESEARGRR